MILYGAGQHARIDMCENRSNADGAVLQRVIQREKRERARERARERGGG